MFTLKVIMKVFSNRAYFRGYLKNANCAKIMCDVKMSTFTSYLELVRGLSEKN